MLIILSVIALNSTKYPISIVTLLVYHSGRENITYNYIYGTVLTVLLVSPGILVSVEMTGEDVLCTFCSVNETWMLMDQTTWRNFLSSAMPCNEHTHTNCVSVGYASNSK